MIRYRIEGTSSIGVTAPENKWYVAEGSTGGSFETWVLLMNPGAQKATAKVTYQTPLGKVTGPVVELPAGTRKTVNVAGTVPDTWEVSTTVESDKPVVCEESMYWDHRKGGHGSVAASQASTIWYMAEGCTEGGFETWVTAQNPGTQAATASVVFLTNSGPVTGPKLTLDPGTRKTVNVASSAPGAAQVSTMVTSDQPIVCERSTYWNARKGGHSSVGATSTSEYWYLPEGSTASGFETWAMILNPSAWRVTAKVTFMTETGPVAGPTLVLQPLSRTTVDAGLYVPGNYSVATSVEATGQVVCDVSCYWGGRIGGTSSVGYCPGQ